MTAARELFAEHGVGAVTTRQIADRADVAIGTLYRYVSTKAELLIMVQNEKFAAAVDDGLADADVAAAQDVPEAVIALIRPVVACITEQIENGRTYLHEPVFGDPDAPCRQVGLALAARLKDGSPTCSPATRTSTPRTRRHWPAWSPRSSTSASPAPPPCTCTAAMKPSSPSSASRSTRRRHPATAPHDLQSASRIQRPTNRRGHPSQVQPLRTGPSVQVRGGRSTVTGNEGRVGLELTADGL
ncbi:TetR/AcrR family transcriptional regulator [Streptomyces griseorubiginosus]|uniref:TetR/AcrR family transcriptional regulator n=1 Tax=Streptomyces griseorubiginosus TaxID=67304 RepID=UPI0036EB10A9